MCLTGRAQGGHELTRTPKKEREVTQGTTVLRHRAHNRGVFRNDQVSNNTIFLLPSKLNLQIALISGGVHMLWNWPLDSCLLVNVIMYQWLNA